MTFAPSVDKETLQALAPAWMICSAQRCAMVCMEICINLLPWREERQYIQKKAFLWMIGLIVCCCILIIISNHAVIARF